MKRLRNSIAAVLALLIAAAPAAALAESFSVIWISDTQNYVVSADGILDRSTEWIIANKASMNIKAVIHTGDVVSTAKAAYQWEAGYNTLKTLSENGLPFIVINGNHDMQPKRSLVNYKNYMYFSGIQTPTGIIGSGEAVYYAFDAGGESFLIVLVGYARVNDMTIKWMNDVIRAYEKSTVIVGTHGYMRASGKLLGEGRRIFNEVAVPNPNVKMIVCGHCRGACTKPVGIDDDGDGVNDRTLYQMLANYQNKKTGHLRILTFDTGMRTCAVSTYSPYLNDYNFYPNSPERDTFTISY